MLGHRRLWVGMPGGPRGGAPGQVPRELLSRVQPLAGVESNLTEGSGIGTATARVPHLGFPWGCLPLRAPDKPMVRRILLSLSLVWNVPDNQGQSSDLRWEGGRAAQRLSKWLSTSDRPSTRGCNLS